jgi:multiple sugar transport system substrate-binding protein
MQSLNAEFMSQNPGIKIDRVAIPYSTYPAKVLAAIASGTGPDVYQLPAPQWVFQYGNGLLPLTKYVTPQQRSDLQGWGEVSEGLKATGTPYALPWQIGGFVFYYNKKLFTKAGLNPSKPPTTWTQLLKDSAQLKAHGITPIAAGFQDGYYLQWFMDIIAGELLTPSQDSAFIESPKWTNNKVLAESIADVKTLYNDGYFTPESTGLGLFTAGLPSFGSGKAAMVLGLFGPVDYWGDFSKDIGAANLGAFAPPLVPGATFSQPRLDTKVELGWAISKKSANPSAAYQYISFMTGPAAQSEAFLQTGVLPNITTAKPVTNNPSGREVLAYWEAGDTYTAPISSAYEASTSSVMWDLATEVLTGGESVSGYLSAIQGAQTPMGQIP